MIGSSYYLHFSQKKRSFQSIIQVFQEFPNINMIFSSWVLVIKNQLPQHWLSAHARLYADNDDTVQLTQWKLPYGAERKPKNKDTWGRGERISSVNGEGVGTDVDASLDNRKFYSEQCSC